MSESSLSQVHALVSGRVQGVGFRYFVLQAANRSEEPLSGWVRNLADGRVELLAEGPRHAVENLLIAVGRGPSSSKVKRIDKQWGEGGSAFSEFSIRPTAQAPDAAA